MIKVLQVISSIGMPGGVQSLLWNYYSRIDTDEVLFDFVVHNNRMEGFERRFVDKGSQIFFVPPKRDGLIKHYKSLKKVITEGEYAAIHVHQDFLGVLTLLAAKKSKVPVRIIHTHKANLKESLLQKMKHRILCFFTKMLATDYFACGIDAAKWTFGKKFFDAGNVRVLSNAINSCEYRFNQEIRTQVRNELCLDGKLVIGNVARFTHQKNQSFLVKVFNEIKKVQSNAVLVCVGDGELLDQVKQEARELGLEESILFLGARSDVNKLLHAMDVFVLTSRFEGLPVTMVEAQAADLPCVVADNITHEININKKVQYAKLQDTPQYWAMKIIESADQPRSDTYEAVCNAGYDIEREAKNLSDFYFRRVKDGKKC